MNYDPLPDVHIGDASNPLPDWRKAKLPETDDEDAPLFDDETLTALLGFNPNELEDEPTKDEQPRIAGGVVLFAPDGKVLLLKRSNLEKNYKEHWSLPGGKGEDGEDAETAVTRECKEETGHSPTQLRLLSQNETPNGMLFHTYESPVDQPFAPKLNAEHTTHGWFSPDNLPKPLHPAVAETLRSRSHHARDSYAIDHKSVRSYSDDGHLHVSTTPISKANICPYFGREIPDGDKMGLEPGRIYWLLRDPDELKKAADTFNNLPLLSKHIPLTADTHNDVLQEQPDLVIGSTGTDSSFDGTYLNNSLSVWPREAINDIESEEKRELSCAYRYSAEMKPGIYKGVKYDGVMRNIRGNHVALVKAGRAGDDVLVSDSKPHIWDFKRFR
jgi:ADP-ribose pyrophosphatase YjhB (NUDIX family)